nr:immunoglobulin light chain junction region [Macaca mulatta]
CQQHNSNPFTF